MNGRLCDCELSGTDTPEPPIPTVREQQIDELFTLPMARSYKEGLLSGAAKDAAHAEAMEFRKKAVVKIVALIADAEREAVEHVVRRGAAGIRWQDDGRSSTENEDLHVERWTKAYVAELEGKRAR